MAVYPDSIRIEIKIEDVWTDYSDKVVGNIDVQYGINGNKPLDRIASTGIMTVNLFAPVLVTDDTISGGKFIGLYIRVLIDYLGATWLVGYGKITSFTWDTNRYGSQITVLNCTDWMNILSSYSMSTLPILTNRTADEGINEVLSEMTILPDDTELDSGNSTFQTIFDSTKGNTTAFSEMSKLVMSEFGFLYLRKDMRGDVLVFENSSHRTGVIDTSETLDTLSYIVTEDGDEIITEDGDYLVYDDGGVSITLNLNFNNQSNKITADYGKNIINQVKGRSYPRFFDDSEEVLYKLHDPIQFDAGDTKTFRVSFVDPYSGSGAKINGVNMIDPVSGTDFKMTQNADGTGTDDTASCTFLTEYSSDGATVTITNGTGSVRYISTMQFRGNPLFLYEPIDIIQQDVDSINDYGFNSMSLDQKYQRDSYVTDFITQKILQREKRPSLKLASVSFYANVSQDMMLSFLLADVGKLVFIIDDKNKINGLYNIQKVLFNITQGGIIFFTWFVVDAYSSTDSFWILGTSQLGINNELGY